MESGHFLWKRRRKKIKDIIKCRPLALVVILQQLWLNLKLKLFPVLLVELWKAVPTACSQFWSLPYLLFLILNLNLKCKIKVTSYICPLLSAVPTLIISIRDMLRILSFLIFNYYKMCNFFYSCRTRLPKT